MPVQTPHADYNEHKETWWRCRTLAAGQKAVKGEGQKFLPKLSGQNAAAYLGYLKRAYYFNAAGRTVDGLVGVVFRKSPAVLLPKLQESFLDSVNLEGSPFESFSRRVFRNIVTTGRHGVLLDVEANETQVNPYFAGYNAEDIINWRMEKINEITRLTLVVLQELIDEEDPKDPYVRKKVQKLRVLKLLPANITAQEEGTGRMVTGAIGADNVFIPADDAVYEVEIWRKNPQSKKEEDKFILEEVKRPQIRGRVLGYIPFVFFGPVEASTLIQKSMIEDLCDVNESHFHSSADIEHGRHFTALPTAWVAGFKTDQDLVIGSQTAWVSEDSAANAGFLEYTGQGLQALETAMRTKEEQMAILGARMLEAPRKAVESADTHSQRKAGEQSVLASAAGSVEQGFKILLEWVVMWMSGNEKPEVKVEFNKDYMPADIDPQMLTALFAALQGSGISWQTFAYNLQKGEVYPDDWTLDDELEAIKEHLADKPQIDIDDEADEDEDDDNEKEEEEETETS